jgi:hypothetical protein
MPRVHELLLKKGTRRNRIVVVVADPRSVMAPALRPSLARERPSNTRAAEMPIVRVLIDDDGGDDDPLYVAIRSYMRQLDREHHVALLVVDAHDRPILTSLPLAPAQRHRRRNRTAIFPGTR